MNRPQFRPQHPLRSQKSLEMAMRDALDGLQDTACQLGFQPFGDCLQILSIESVSETPPTAPARVTNVLHFPPDEHPGRSSNVLDFLLQREAGLCLPHSSVHS